MTSVEIANQSRTGKFGVFLLIATVAFTTTLDNTIVTVALPAAARQLNCDPAALEWVGVGYMLPFAGLLLVAGAAVDRWGPRRCLLAGLTAFGLAALGGGLAESLGALVAARVVQGVSAALVMPAALSVLRTALPERGRHGATALWTAAIAAALAGGPVIGGALTEYLRWNWVLLVNVPFAAVALLVTLLAVPRDGRRVATRVDWTAAMLAAVAATAATATLIGTGPRVVTAVPAVLAAAAFVRRQRRGSNPLVPPDLLRQPVFAAALVLQLLWGIGVTGIFFFTPLFLQDMLRLTPTQAGLPLLLVAASVAVVTPFVAPATARFGARRVVASGLSLVAIGLVMVAMESRSLDVITLLPGLIVIGVGSAATAPLTSAALGVVDAARSGAASGALTASRELAGALGVAVIGLVVPHGFAAAALVAGAFELLAAVLAAVALRPETPI